MKIQRQWLLMTTGSIGVLMILYTIARQFFDVNFGEKFEKFFFDGVFIAAIGLMLLNRKLAGDEKKAALEAKEKLERAASAETDSGSVHDETDSEGR